LSILYAVLGFVVLERAAELRVAESNTSRLRAQGAFEVDARFYPWFVVMHAAWLASILALVPAKAAPSWPLITVFAALQLGRLWVIATLGRRWTTRIIVKPGAAPVTSGPYRYLRHPNYAVVAAEIAVLPLAFGATAIALTFSAANLALIARRIAIEDRALAASSRPDPISFLLGDGAPRVEALDVPALGACGRVDDGIDQRRLS
jgi:methyltransferase